MFSSFKFKLNVVVNVVHVLPLENNILVKTTKNVQVLFKYYMTPQRGGRGGVCNGHCDHMVGELEIDFK